MEATEHMKNGGKCDLLELLSAREDFGMDAAALEEALEPGKYVGRCVSQVDAFLREITPVLEGVEVSTEDLDV